MEEAEHEPWCDRNHTPRQRCNSDMAPAAVTDAPSVTNGVSTTNETAEVSTRPEHDAPAEVAPPASAESVPEPSILQRDVAVATGMPSPSPYARQAWERTEDRLGQGDNGDERDDPYAPPPPHDEIETVPRAAVMATIAVLLLALVVMMRRLVRRP